MMNKEHRMKNDEEVDYSRDSAMPQPRFLFFLLRLPYFSQNLSMLNARTLYSASLMPIYSKKWPLEPWQLAQAS